MHVETEVDEDGFEVSLLNSRLYSLESEGDPPTAPSDLTAVALSKSQISLSWRRNSTNEAFVEVERKAAGGGSFQVVAELGSNVWSYVDTELSATTQYEYRVRAANNAGYSSYSDEVAATTTIGLEIPLTGVALWLRADAGVMLLSNTNVTQWNDISGNRNNVTQSNTNKQPVYLTNALNGRTALRFDGGDALQSTATNLLTAGGPRTIIVAARCATNDDGGALLTFRKTTLVFAAQFAMSGGSFYAYSDGFSSANNGRIADALTTLRNPFFSSHVSPGVSSKIGVSINGDAYPVTQSGVISSESGSAGFIVGARDDTSIFNWVGEIAEVFVYDSALSASDRAAIESYLNVAYQVLPMPAVPTNIVTDALSASQVRLSWKGEFATNTVFVIERKLAPEGSYDAIGSVTGALFFTDTNLTANTQYTYRIKATRLGYHSAYSDEADVTTFSDGPDWPLSSLKLWLRADSLANAGSVALWDDQSGSGNNFSQSTSGQRPVKVDAAINGKPVIRFDGVDDSLFRASAVATNDFTLFIVARTPLTHEVDAEGASFGGSSGQRFVLDFDAGIYDSSKAISALSWGTNGVSIYEYRRQSIGSDQIPPVAVHTANMTTNASIVAMSYQERVPSLFRNGERVRVGLQSPRSQVLSPLRIGKSGSSAFNGDVAEILVFNTPLSDAQRLMVERYLNAVYGVVNDLPSAPTNLVAFAVASNQVHLAWTGPSTNLTEYRIERRLDSEAFQEIASVSGRTTTFFDTNVAPSTLYTYRVRASKLTGNSAYSNEAEIVSPGGGAGILTDKLTLWLQADGDVYKDDADRVNKWMDRSSRLNHSIQATVVDQPTRVMDQANGRPILRFDGSGDHLIASSLTGTNEFTVLLVARTDKSHEIDSETSTGFNGNSGQKYVLSHTQIASLGYTTNGAGISLGTNGVSAYERQHNQIGSPTYPSLAVAATNLGTGFSLIGLTYSNREPRIYLNGALLRVGLTSARTNILAPIQIGGEANGYFNGDVAEVMIFEKTLTPAERRAAEAFLNAKYAIVPNLPGTPTISAVEDQTMDEDSSLLVQFTVGDAETSASSLIVNAYSSNTNLISNANLTLGGSDAERSVTIHPNTNQFGVATIVLEVIDSDGFWEKAAFKVVVNPVNDAPEAVEFTVITMEDNAVELTLIGSDVEYSILTFELVSLPQHGSVSGDSPYFVYTPSSNYFGEDSFQYQANDGSLVSAPATVRIIISPVADDPPVAHPGSITINEDEWIEATLSASDPDGDNLVYSIVSGPEHGRLFGSLPGFIYQPDGDFNGEDGFWFQVSDGAHFSTNFVSVTASAVNDPPRFATAGVVVLDEDFVGQVDIPIVVSPVPSDELGQVVTYQISPVDVDFATISFNSTSGLFSITALTNGFGTQDFQIVADDGEPINGKFTNSLRLVVKAVNDPPTVAITNILSGALFTTPTNLLLAAHAEDIDGLVEHVAFFVDGSLVGSFTAPPFSAVWTNAIPGEHMLVAVAMDNGSLVSTSSPVAFSVSIQPDTDYDGRSDIQELLDGTDPNDPSSVTLQRLAYWSFDDLLLRGEREQLPRSVANINRVLSWRTNAISLQGTNSSYFQLNDVENDGSANINLQNGTIRFWFKPHWSSADQGGAGPEAEAILISVGRYPSNLSNGFWSLLVDSSGTNISFLTRTNASITTNLMAQISWKAGFYHQIALTYSSTNSSLYVDGEWIADGGGVSIYPNVAERNAFGIGIGSDAPGGHLAKGDFEDWEAFNYPLGIGQIRDDYDLVFPEVDSDGDGLSDQNEILNGTRPDLPDTDGDGMPDGWEVGYGFNPLAADGTNDDDGDGVDNATEFKLGRNPRIPHTVPDTSGLINLRTFTPLK